MTKEEALEEREEIRQVVKDWNAEDPWHDAVYDRYSDLFDWAICANGKDPGPWTMPPVPEGIEP